MNMSEMIILTSHLHVSTVASNLPPIIPSTSMKRLMALCLMHAVIAPRDFNSPWSLQNMSMYTLIKFSSWCTNCLQKFTTNQGMKLHAKLHQGYIFQCDHCKYNSTSQTNLDQHVVRSSWGQVPHFMWRSVFLEAPGNHSSGKIVSSVLT